eukprot:scaffold227096_cov18-Tisochrysis_lutea.AAC.1
MFLWYVPKQLDVPVVPGVSALEMFRCLYEDSPLNAVYQKAVCAQSLFLIKVMSVRALANANAAPA